MTAAKRIPAALIDGLLSDYQKPKNFNLCKLVKFYLKVASIWGFD